MFDATDLDQRLTKHLTRVASINREAWMQGASMPAGLTRARRISIDVSSIRRRAGSAIIYAGYRLLPPSVNAEARS